MKDQSQKCRKATLKDSHNATSSQVLADGHLQLDLLDGLMKDHYGLGQRHANRSQQQETKRGKTTSATYGLNSSILSALADQQSSWVSRLVQRFDLDGSMECLLTWKVKDTPQGRLLFQLAPSMRPIKEKDYGLWATPNTMDSLPPRGKDAMRKQFSTTRKGRAAPANLREQVHPEMYPAALWPTPISSDNRDRGSWHNPSIQRRLKLGKQIGLTALVQGCSSTAQTESQGALNPEFPCWLMGYPLEWLDEAP